ncbi:PilZ domain-containing protein [Aquabacterium sp.]|uniref:PilZ domain-containing protein n=1 Tax=Aquabacterium sp. TaxID=1872578 RepID=UPI00403800D6
MPATDLTSQQQATDARLGPRANVSWAARVVLNPQSYVEARVVNVSADGLGLVCERAFPDGAMLHILIALPDPLDRSKYHYPDLHTKVMFHVAKGGKFRMGTRFARIDPGMKALIETWVQKG